MKRKITLCLLCPLLLLLLTSCIKDYEEEIDGIWDVVNVADIDNTVPHEWHFIANELTIYRQNNNVPGGLHKIDAGRYSIRRTANGSYLRVGEMNFTTYNDDWHIIMLKKNKMILSLSVPGEVIYKEFTKRDNN